MSSPALRYATSAKSAKHTLATLTGVQKRNLLNKMADHLISHSESILEGNQQDMADGRKAGLSNALLDRLLLNPERIQDMASSLRQIAQSQDPVGEKYDFKILDNGLEIAKMRVPIGVVMIIFESRPNVASDAAGLCLMSGNACILRGGKEAIHSVTAIGRSLKHALSEMKLPPELVTIVEDPDRNLMEELLQLDQHIDLVVPRGGEGLIGFVTEHSRIPVVKHDKGLCHVYLDAKADHKMAHQIAINSKVQRPGVCNAMETLLVHKDIAGEILPKLCAELEKKKVEIRGCSQTVKICPDQTKVATEEDWNTEYLDLILNLRIVESFEQAIEHIRQYGSGHSEAIVTDDYQRARQFQTQVDAAAVYVNASTRFTDGGQFGMGAEIGISTQKLHCRGPMGLRDLTSSKYIINGSGHIR
ncbi:glutamate-5-semialdehyde dehydrogenase [Desulfurispira natronophila]|uniref:Gamma-glutamyl phosphate reductase n=1 Tax=Desulfurispira natronophila TaxID=682562 RepID=A0A7W7Y2B7_9BACT|nr:glutamate-5-semialdehyde dehydrogenase [Desulfurispira natronophila]MBB5020800.1 glutamate-5-semialdehyde dehydrogenase [Desulfurispira natronophila]